MNPKKIDDLYEQITGENGFLVKLRSENHFSETDYEEIIETIKSLVIIWKSQELIPKKGVLAICQLIDQLSGGNRFLSEEDALKVEDASIEVMEILDQLE